MSVARNKFFVKDNNNNIQKRSHGLSLGSSDTSAIHQVTDSFNSGLCSINQEAFLATTAFPLGNGEKYTLNHQQHNQFTANTSKHYKQGNSQPPWANQQQPYNNTALFNNKISLHYQNYHPPPHQQQQQILQQKNLYSGAGGGAACIGNSGITPPLQFNSNYSLNQQQQRGCSTSSSRKHTPEKKVVALKSIQDELNFPKCYKELNEIENLNNLTVNQLSRTNKEFLQIKRKLKFNLLRNVYDRRCKNVSHNTQNNANNCSINNYNKYNSNNNNTLSTKHQHLQQQQQQQQQQPHHMKAFSEKNSRAGDYVTPSTTTAHSRGGFYNQGTSNGLNSTSNQQNSTIKDHNKTKFFLRDNNFHWQPPQTTSSEVSKFLNRSYGNDRHLRMESALSNVDDSTLFSGYDKSTPIDLKQILPSNLNSTKNESFDCAYYSKSENKISRASPYSVASNNNCKNSKSSAGIDMMEKGKKLFKDNDLNSAIDQFKQALSSDPQLLESHYLLGVCYLGNNEYQQAVKEFTNVIEKNPNYRKNIYLLISIALKKLNNIQEAIRILGKAIQRYPRYYDAYIYQGKLHIKDKKLERALSDFNCAISINAERGLGYLGKADCLRLMGQYIEAIKTYTKAIEAEQQIKYSAILKRAICSIEGNVNSQEAMEDLKIVLQNDPSSSEAYYFKGILLLKQSNPSEAVLSFEQAIKHNNSRKAVTKSLYEIAKAKIEERDFYSAFHTLERSEFLEIDTKMLQKFKIFTEGVIFLMKRKHKEAIDNFNKLTRLYPKLGDFVKPLLHTYRAYGFFCLSKHQNALYDYLTAERLNAKALPKNTSNCTQQQQRNQEKKNDNNSNEQGNANNKPISEDRGSMYNKLLCEGILSIQANNFDAGIACFNKAAKVFENKVEPQFYKGVAYIRQAYQLEKQQQIKEDLILRGLKELDQAIDISDSNANLFYIRAVIRSYLGYFQDGIQDIDKAIEKSEDNIPKYFFLRGLCFGCLKMYKQAISDFTICLQLDENFGNAYLERAKSYFFQHEQNSAFADLQKYIAQHPQDPNIHLWAGNLLFNSGAHDDAIKAYTHSDLINEDYELLLQRAKCYLVLHNANHAEGVQNIDHSYQDFNRILEIRPCKQIAFDRGCLLVIKTSISNNTVIQSKDSQNSVKVSISKSETNQERFQTAIQKLERLIKAQTAGKFFGMHDAYLYLGVLHFYQQQYEQAIVDFQQAQTLKESITQQSSGNIKLEDEKELNNYKQENNIENEYLEENLTTSFQQQQFQEELDKENIVQDIFNKKDNKKNKLRYQQRQMDLQINEETGGTKNTEQLSNKKNTLRLSSEDNSSNVPQLNLKQISDCDMEQLEQSNNCEGQQSNQLDSSEQVEDEEQLEQDYYIEESFTTSEIQYNIAMCHLMQKDYKKAYNICLKLSNSIQDQFKDYYNVLIKILYHEIDVLNIEKSLQNSASIVADNDYKKVQNLKIFQQEDRLCSMFPPFTPFFSSVGHIEMRLSFGLPKIEPPSLHHQFDHSLIQQISILSVENKPEAPWIKRNNNGIVFTDNIQYFESLDLDTEEKEKKKGNNDIIYYDEDDEFDKNHIYYDSRENEKMDIHRLKEKLKLDNDIEEKLNKLMKKKPQQQLQHQAAETKENNNQHQIQPQTEINNAQKSN